MRPSIAKNEDEQCVATTKAGSRCKLLKTGDKHCDIHDVTIPACGEKTVYGDPCRNIVMKDQLYCVLHDPYAVKCQYLRWGIYQCGNLASVDSADFYCSIHMATSRHDITSL